VILIMSVNRVINPDSAKNNPFDRENDFIFAKKRESLWLSPGET
jgi:hypothetical protein